MIAIRTVITPLSLFYLSPPGVFPCFRSCCGLEDADYTYWRTRHHDQPFRLKQYEKPREIHLSNLDLLPNWQLQRAIVDLCGRVGQWRISMRNIEALPYSSFYYNKWRDKRYRVPGKPVCWHGHRKFMEVLFKADPNATITLPMIAARPPIVSSKGQKRYGDFYRTRRVFKNGMRLIEWNNLTKKQTWRLVEWHEAYDLTEQVFKNCGYFCDCAERGEI